jgi:UDP-glucuronate decarboxylase
MRVQPPDRGLPKKKTNGVNGVNGVAHHPPSPRRRRNTPPGALVAGGAGFLGSHLCTRLIEDGYRVYCIDNFHTGLASNIEHLASDPRFILMDHDIRIAPPAFDDVVEIYNLACPASPPHYKESPVETVTTSVLGTLNLLSLADKLGARFLLTSTSEIYGDPEVHPQPESYRGSVNPIGPRACYDESKRMAETLCYDFVRQKGTDVRVARVFNTYGPRMRLDDGRIVSNLVSQALSGEPMTIYGSGKQTRSFCYVADLVEGLLRLMRHPGRLEGPVNLGNPDEYSVLQLAAEIAALAGQKVTMKHSPLPEDDPRRRRPDIDLAIRLLDWRPSVPLRVGLTATIEWFAPLVAARSRPAAGPAGVAPRRTRAAEGASSSPGSI